MKFLQRPEYIFRPTQIARRLALEVKKRNGEVWVRTHWNLPLLIDARELHGRAMLSLGIVDLRVSEVIWRLVEKGDKVVDVGANVGTLLSVLAFRAGASGHVTAFEPHPVTRSILKRSVERWPQLNVDVLPYALSSTVGEAHLKEPEGFSNNSGIARLETATMGRTHKVETVTFDSHFSSGEVIKLVKIDVEGHEDEVLEGMQNNLRAGSVLNVIFEDFRPMPSPACAKLTALGFRCYLINRDLFGIKLIPVEDSPPRVKSEPTSILATSREATVGSLLKTRGWRSLSYWHPKN
jgi:FkbM family methyltransferase